LFKHISGIWFVQGQSCFSPFSFFSLVMTFMLPNLNFTEAFRYYDDDDDEMTMTMIIMMMILKMTVAIMKMMLIVFL